MAALFFPAFLSLFSPKISIQPLKSSKNSISFLLSSSIAFESISKRCSKSSHIKCRIQETQLDPSTLPPNLVEIISLFQSVSDPRSKYQQLLHYGKKLPPYPPEFRINDHRVWGCVSQVWVRAYPDPNDPSKIKFDADSDSTLTKGLAALLVLGLSGETASAICQVLPEFVQFLGLKQSMTPSRNNGFLNMLKLMQKKAAEIGGIESNQQDEFLIEKTSNLDESNVDFERNLVMEEDIDGNLEINNNLEIDVNLEIKERSKVNDNTENEYSGGRSERIKEKLEKELKPIELEIEDASYIHGGHAEVRGGSSGETHFNLKIVSSEFEGKSLVKRHRLVYDLLKEELDSGLHALSIVAKTPSEARVQYIKIKMQNNGASGLWLKTSCNIFDNRR